MEFLEFDFDTIAKATDKFSEANKLGQGGFGAVYKGALADGQKIAVKRLSNNSQQGDLEFKTEILLVAKLQHRHLVRLLGFCIQGSERLLVYEFVPNASLDQFIFDPTKGTLLDWETRYKIIRGIACGVRYLHEESRLRVIHRDLKASNILLDGDMNPQIADFGMAKLFNLDQSQAMTSKIAGTYGYMAPEYIMAGQLSVKSDVFSFGVILLEIVSGKKNNFFRSGENIEHISGYAWKKWKNGTTISMVDPLLTSGSSEEMMRCIHIGLLCCQYNVADRPTIREVMLMLDSSSYTLQAPTQPGFLMDAKMDSDLSPSAENNLKTTSSSKFNFLNKIGLGFFQKKKKEKSEHGNRSAQGIDDMDDIKNSMLFDFETIKVATDNFSDANIIGDMVYKGLLADNRQKVAVKMITKSKFLEDFEFQREGLLLATMQHQNIVQLLGFCPVHDQELLVYEFLPNSSLDHFIFDPTKRTLLDWEKRYNIIQGIARGVLYIHENCSDFIIHHDLQARKIMLDENMVPKIRSYDRLIAYRRYDSSGGIKHNGDGINYRPPEYRWYRGFSVKSDVFSFGVIVLETVSGRKYKCEGTQDNPENLLSSAWKSWKDGTLMNIVDVFLTSEFSEEMMRCLHIGLLCVQEKASDRPKIADVVLMLNSHTVTLPFPTQPATLRWPTN